MRRALAIVIAAACGSSTPAVAPARFVNAPPVTVVDDRRDVPRPPQRREFMRYLFHLDGSVHRPIQRSLSLRGKPRALGVNALDEVPDSTWFTNRIGVRDISVDELRTAPGGVGSPEPHLPWTVQSSKVGGQSVGFIVKDTRGERWLLKFDMRGFPEMETGAHVIVGKLLWAAGYNVTEDYVVYLRASDLALADDAFTYDALGKRRPLDAETFRSRLASIDVGEDGVIRALASRMLDGKALGGHSAEGVRRDDPNDRIPHQHRRDLRGMSPLFAWLDHVDVQEGNFLDMWVSDPTRAGRRYVRHYLIDFGKSLGVMAATSHNLRRSTEYYIDVDGITTSLLSLGTAGREWQQRQASLLRGIGAFDAGTFDPRAWKPTTPAYVPFANADRHDKFWGAKLVMRFTREQIQAAVDAARFSDPVAAHYMVETLVARQRRIGRHYFARVAPLDQFAYAGGKLCFVDLAVHYGFVRGSRYALTSHDTTGRALAGATVARAGSQGRVCATVPLTTGTGYTIVGVEIGRPRMGGAVEVHLARNLRTGLPQIIGLWRL